MARRLEFARLAFAPCLQYQYAAGKNYCADMALALDALEALFDERADTAWSPAIPIFALPVPASCVSVEQAGVHRRGDRTPGQLAQRQRPVFEWVRPRLASRSSTPLKSPRRNRSLHADPRPTEGLGLWSSAGHASCGGHVARQLDTSEGKVGLGRP